MPVVRLNQSAERWPGIFSAFFGIIRRIGPAWPAFLSAAALSLIGIYVIDVGQTLDGHGLTEIGPVASRQLLYAVAGSCAAVLIALPHYRWLGYASWVMLALSIGLLIFLLVPFVPASIVRARNGARSWIDLGPMDLQPSELAKIACVLALAWYLRYKQNHRTFVGLLPPAVIVGVPVGLTLLQPDLGTALLFIPALFAMLVAAGAKLKHLGLIVLLATLAAPAAYPLLKPHQKERIVGLFMQFKKDRSADQDVNMQSVTAQRLAGAGGVDGVGDTASRTLVKYNALPERHNDMIFAVLVNRFGFLGGLGVLSLYLVWSASALLTAGLCREPFGRLVPVGFVGFMIAQVIVNVGMNLGILPIIGITLPFVSHGGSSMLTVWVMTGIVISIAVRQPRGIIRRSFEFEDD